MISYFVAIKMKGELRKTREICPTAHRLPIKRLQS